MLFLFFHAKGYTMTKLDWFTQFSEGIFRNYKMLPKQVISDSVLCQNRISPYLGTALRSSLTGQNDPLACLPSARTTSSNRRIWGLYNIQSGTRSNTFFFCLTLPFFLSYLEKFFISKLIWISNTTETGELEHVHFTIILIFNKKIVKQNNPVLSFSMFF